MSYYLDPNNFIHRLRQEWEQYGGLIIAVDYDSTLIPFHEYEHSADFDDIRYLVRECKKYGCTIIIFTAAAESRIPEIKENLAKLEIPYDLFNESPSYIKDIGRTTKVYANVYLDDRAGLYQVYTTLSALLVERKYLALQNEVCGEYYLEEQKQRAQNDSGSLPTSNTVH